MPSLGKKIFRIIFSLVLVSVSAYYAARDVKLDKLWDVIVRADYLWIILSIPIIAASHWVRAMRWRSMLEPALKTKAPSTWNLFSAVMIGYAFNCVLPRGGEFVRPYVYSRREKVSFTSVFGTIIVERAIDVATLAVLFAFVFIFLGRQILAALPEVDPGKVLFVVSLVVLVIFLSFYPPIFKFLLATFVKPISGRLYQKIGELFDKFLKGFAVIKTPGRYARVIVESLAIWFLYTLPMYLMFFSFDFQAKLSLGFDDAILLIVISGIGVTIAPTPGAVGVYHWLIKNAMARFFGVPPEAALAYATLTHGVNYLVQIVLGGLFFLRENVKKVPLDEEDIGKEEAENSMPERS